jgi:hypothetical protein
LPERLDAGSPGSFKAAICGRLRRTVRAAFKAAPLTVSQNMGT